MELLETCFTSSSSSSSLLSPKYTFPTTQALNRRRYNLQSCGNRATAAVKSASSSAVWNGYAGSSGDISRANYNDNNTTNKLAKTAIDSTLEWILAFYVIVLLAKEGFLVISVPYNVTFDHADAAKQVYERFNACLDSVLESGLPRANLTPAQISELPQFSVGRSNGALLQVLTGSYFCERIPKANAIISCNNRPVTEAVPYFEQERNWQVGNVYTPADAIAQGLKTLSLNDSRVLVRTVSNWFRRFED